MRGKNTFFIKTWVRQRRRAIKINDTSMSLFNVSMKHHTCHLCFLYLAVKLLNIKNKYQYHIWASWVLGLLTNQLSFCVLPLPRCLLSNQRAGRVWQGVGPSDRTLRCFPGGTSEGDLQPELLPQRVSQSQISTQNTQPIRQQKLKKQCFKQKNYLKYTQNFL